MVIRLITLEVDIGTVVGVVWCWLRRSIATVRIRIRTKKQYFEVAMYSTVAKKLGYHVFSKSKYSSTPSKLLLL